jgi:hypothetical protein
MHYMVKISHLGRAYGTEGTKHRPFMKAGNNVCQMLLITTDCLHIKRVETREEQSMALFEESFRFSYLDYSLQVRKQFALKIYNSKH